MGGELLLELLSEEIPARMQRGGLQQLTERVEEFLGNAYLVPDSLVGFVTPRRLTIVATGIPQQQQASDDSPDERRGPRVGAPEAAVKGFCRSVGLAPEDLEQRDGYYFAKIERPGSPAPEILPKVIAEAIEEIVWPKSMRFPGCTLHWVRPLVSVICLFDGEIVPLALGQVPVGRVTKGHRFLSKGEISVVNAADYRKQLEAGCVVLDWDLRRKQIEDGLTGLAKDAGLVVKPDPGLLDEVTGLVEFPVVLIGRIDEASMALPAEVLATAMRTHQKYFSCLNADSTPAARFLFVANNLTADGGRTIVAGNERVLRARLADARFFWEQDRKARLEDRVEALKDRVYHAKLGTMYDKTERMERIAQDLAFHLNVDVGRVRRAARLAKADLSTGMVGEFPELQGVMGRYYALNDGEDPRVADAIAEHYKPLGPNDTCPIAKESIVVALADKLDTLARFFWIGERPTGSGDPFALRRAALGVIRVILENNLRLPLSNVLNNAVDPVPSLPPDQVMQIVISLTRFIGDRLWVQLRGQGVRHDLIDAVLMIKEDDLVRLMARVGALQNFLDTDDGSNLLTAYRRAANIVAIEAERDRRQYDDARPELSGLQPEELALWNTLEQVAEEARKLRAEEKFEEAMAALATLRRPVDEFFAKVTVNTDDPKLRENRLRLLSRIPAVMNQVADFSKIEG